MQVKNDFFVIGGNAEFYLSETLGGGAIRTSEHYYLKLRHSKEGYELELPCDKEFFERNMHAKKISIEFIIAD